MIIKKYYIGIDSEKAEECTMKRCAEKEFRRKDNFTIKCCCKLGHCWTRYERGEKEMLKK
jgi:hypothetical protein